MGASRKSPGQKCADLFINIKSIKNKAKAFTFQCTLCDVACDQLKRFSKHLETHLEYFQNQLENAIDNTTFFGVNEIKVDNNPFFGTNEIKVDNNPFFGTNEIKVETEVAEQLNCDNETVLGDHKPLFEIDDPLETEKIYKVEMALTDPIVKEENDVEEKETILESSSTLPSNKNLHVEEAAVNVDGFNKNFLELNDLCSDDSLEHTSDSDFSTKKKPNNTKRSSKSMEEINETDTGNASNCNKPKKRRRTIIVTSILPFLIQQYKKYEILWQTDDIAFGIKVKKNEVLTKIAEAIKLEKNKVISLGDLNYHIHYINELYAKDKEQELKCKLEKLEFVPAYEYYKELSFLSKSQGPFLCSICNEILPRYHVYCLHLALHNDTQPYKCPLCDLTFVKYDVYLVHKKRHLGIYDFHCKICGKGYMFKNDLEWHVTSHTGVKPYLCQICGTGFRARHGYDNHVRRHEGRFRYECHICKKGFNQLSALKKHVKSHLNVRDVICNVCDKGFTHRQNLLRHMKIHGKEKQYKCNDCEKAFSTADGLRSHRKRRHS